MNSKAIIRSESEAAWLAALVDGEGYLGISFKRPASYSPKLTISSVDREILEHVEYLVRHGNILSEKRDTKDIFRFRVAGEYVTQIIRSIYKFLIIKKKQAILINTLQHINDGKLTITSERHRLFELIKACNQREDPELPEYVIYPGGYVS